LDLYSASSLKQQSAGRHVTPLKHFLSTAVKPKTLSLDRAEHIDKMKGDSPNSLSDPPTQLRKCRQPALMIGILLSLLVCASVMEIYLRIKKENHQFLTHSYCFIITFIVVFYIKLSTGVLGNNLIASRKLCFCVVVT
jgi:hypothetical protein